MGGKKEILSLLLVDSSIPIILIRGARDRKSRGVTRRQRRGQQVGFIGREAEREEKKLVRFQELVLGRRSGNGAGSRAEEGEGPTGW